MTVSLVPSLCIFNTLCYVVSAYYRFHLCSWIYPKKYLFILYALQRQNTEISKQIFPEKEYRGLSPNFHIHASVSDLYIPTIGLPILLEEICRPILGLYKSLTDTWNVEIGAEAALFPGKEYINEIFIAVCSGLHSLSVLYIVSTRCPPPPPFGRSEFVFIVYNYYYIFQSTL
jgi:hypothetical protein